MVQASMDQKDFSICSTAGFARPVNNCGKRPRTSMSAITRSTVNPSPRGKSGQPLHLPGNGPLKTRCKIVSRKIEVNNKPGIESNDAREARLRAPLKMRNSPGKPFSPGNPSEAKSAIPISPQNTGAAWRKPPKSFSPRSEEHTSELQSREN